MTVTHNPAKPPTVIELPDFMGSNTSPSQIHLHNPKHLRQAAHELTSD